MRGLRFNLSSMALGVGIGHIVQLCAMPILARLYDPADFGVYALCLSILSYAVLISTMRFEMFIPVAQKESKGISIFLLTIILAIFFSIICLLIAICLPLFWMPELNSEYAEILRLSYLFPIGVLACSIYTSLDFLNTRYQNFDCISRTRVTLKGGTAAGQILFSPNISGFLMGRAGLFVGYVFGQFVGCVSLAGAAFRGAATQWREAVRLLPVVFREYVWGAFNNMLSGFVEIGVNTAVILFLSFEYSSSVSGKFAFVNTIMSAPATFIGAVFGQVLFREGAEKIAGDPGRVRHIYSRFLRVILVLTIPCYAVIAIWGPQLFAFVFGEEWRLSGEMARFMIVPSWLGLVFVPMAFVPLFTSHLSWKLAWGVVRLIFLVALMGAACVLYEDRPILIVIVNSTVITVSYIVFIVKMFRVIRAREKAVEL